MRISNLLKSSHSLIPLTKPLTPRSLNIIRAVLSALKEADKSPSFKAVAPRNAAVLIPFCNGRFGTSVPLSWLLDKSTGSYVLLNHFSFPGGRVDKTDKSFVGTALRETHEELGISPERVDVLGEIGPPQLNFRGDMCVWPFVGFVHPESVNDLIRNTSEDDALPSLDLLSLHSEVSSHEVAVAFHVPLALLADPKRHRTSSFRDSLPYITVDVKDVVEDVGGRKVGIKSLSNEGTDINNDIDEHERRQRIEVWGLTGWYLSMLMRILHIFP